MLNRPEIWLLLLVGTDRYLVGLAVRLDLPRVLLLLVHAHGRLVSARLIRLSPGLRGLLRRVMVLVGRNPPGAGGRQVFVPIHGRQAKADLRRRH